MDLSFYYQLGAAAKLGIDENHNYVPVFVKINLTTKEEKTIEEIKLIESTYIDQFIAGFSIKPEDVSVISEEEYILHTGE